MRILLLGRNGQVGYELARSLAPLGEVMAPRRAELDLASARDVGSCLDTCMPAAIVNAAAWTAVDDAESHKAAAWRLNAELPAQLGEWAARHGAFVIHYSSDYVYDGKGEHPRDESAITGPLSHYGESKLAGDEWLAQSGAPHVVFRTSWVYSTRGRNFMKTMLRLGEKKAALSVVDDQVGAPTTARLIADVSAHALLAKTQNQLASGVYHLAASGETSWRGFAAEIFAQATEWGMGLRMKPDAVAPISTAEWSTPATRPLNSRLSCAKLERALGLTLPNWQDGLRLTLEDYAKNLSD